MFAICGVALRVASRQPIPRRRGTASPGPVPNRTSPVRARFPRRLGETLIRKLQEAFRRREHLRTESRSKAARLCGPARVSNSSTTGIDGLVGDAPSIGAAKERREPTQERAGPIGPRILTQPQVRRHRARPTGAHAMRQLDLRTSVKNQVSKLLRAARYSCRPSITSYHELYLESPRRARNLCEGCRDSLPRRCECLSSAEGYAKASTDGPTHSQKFPRSRSGGARA